MTEWITDPDGWQHQTRPRSSGINYRLLVQDNGKPSYAGSALRYAQVFALPDGKVLATSAAGFNRWYDSVDEAKAAVAAHLANHTLKED